MYVHGRSETSVQFSSSLLPYGVQGPNSRFSALAGGVLTHLALSLTPQQSFSNHKELSYVICRKMEATGYNHIKQITLRKTRFL